MAIPLRSRVWGVVLRARPLKSIRSNEVTDCVPTTTFQRPPSNDHLHREKTQIYGGICKLWIPVSARPVILVDWSDLDDCKNAFLISATLACDGRLITLYLEVHPLNKKEKPAIHKHFWQHLPVCCPLTAVPLLLQMRASRYPGIKWY